MRSQELVSSHVYACLADSFPFGSLRASAHRLHYILPSEVTSER
jgi:hypothetical protein